MCNVSQHCSTNHRLDAFQFFKKNVAQPHLNPSHHRIRRIIEHDPEPTGRMPYSWLHHNLVKGNSSDKTGHPCQIPEDLAALLIEASTQPGDTVLVLFGGSGAEAIRAAATGRSVITADLEPRYCDIIRQRIQEEVNLQSDSTAYTDIAIKRQKTI